jgi:beta-barrel assembly-enhancing protease
MSLLEHVQEQRWLAIVLLLAIISNGCVSTDLPPLKTSEKSLLEDDERRLWLRVQDEEKRLDASGQLYDNAALVRYVNMVAHRLMPEATDTGSLNLEVKIIKNPLLNAFAYPNGVVYVHTGILARMENEAQLATLLGHEITHATHRHAVKNQRSLKNKTALFAGMQALLLPFGAYGGIVALLGAVGMRAAVSGYSQNLEEEADVHGLEMMVKAGYAPGEASRIFEHLKRDVEERQIKEPFFFGTHPRLQERIESYTELLAEQYAETYGDTNAEPFMQQICPLIIENASSDLALGRFGLAEAQIRRVLQREPNLPQAHFALGEVYRQRNGPGDFDKAETALRQAITADASYAEPHKALGLIYFKTGRKKDAKTEWQRYLTLAPHASDISYIQHHLHGMQ